MARSTKKHRPIRLSVSSRRLMVLTLGLGVLAGAMPIAAAGTSHANLLHARAVESFRQGRFPEAYGRFIGLANAGHAASARYALWMCEQGPALFGKDWDCAPHESDAWAALSGVAPARIDASRYATVPRRSLPQGR
jgi:hypothetical protein